MRINARLLLAVISIVWISVVSCSSNNNVFEEPENVSQYEVFLDHELKVMILGNSYSVDATAYLDELVTAAKIDKRQLCVYNGVINGGGFEDWINKYNSKETVSLERVTGGIQMESKQSLGKLLNQNWDVILLLQVSRRSYDWNSFVDNVPILLDIIRSNCLNSNVKIAYQIPWGHNVYSTPHEFRGNIECARRIMNEFDIQHIVPVGVAVQNARNTSLNTDLYLTWDNWHLCYGVGKYVAACTFFESIISPLAHISVVGNSSVHPLTNKEKTYDGSVAVDEDNRLLCQKCAYFAVRDTFVVAEELNSSLHN